MKPKDICRQLLDVETSDSADIFDDGWQFGSVKLLVDVGPFKAGDTVEIAAIDFGRGMISIWQYNSPSDKPDIERALKVTLEPVTE